MSGRVVIDEEAAGDPLIYASNRDVPQWRRFGVRFADGMLHPSDAPGLGVEYIDEAAARFPYQPRYLPVARRPDGSVHDW